MRATPGDHRISRQRRETCPVRPYRLGKCGVRRWSRIDDDTALGPERPPRLAPSRWRNPQIPSEPEIQVGPTIRFERPTCSFREGGESYGENTAGSPQRSALVRCAHHSNTRRTVLVVLVGRARFWRSRGAEPNGPDTDARPKCEARSELSPRSAWAGPRRRRRPSRTRPSCRRCDPP